MRTFNGAVHELNLGKSAMIFAEGRNNKEISFNYSINFLRSTMRKRLFLTAVKIYRRIAWRFLNFLVKKRQERQNLF